MPDMKAGHYAIKIVKKDLALIIFLNDGKSPNIKNVTRPWLVFDIDDKGKSITTKVVSERELHQTREIAGNSPFIPRLKPL